MTVRQSRCAHAAVRHSTTIRRFNMTDLRSLRVLCLLLAGVLSEPTPGRVPKVYNALITSNQNLEPSKAYPVYQPVIHEAAFPFPFQPSVYYGGDFPLSNVISSASAPATKDSSAAPSSPAPSSEVSTEKAPEVPEEPAVESSSPQPDDKNVTPAPPLPPNTQSPIPLNEFGLPSQVIPLGRFDPAYDGFTHVGSPFTYTYPGFRFYDPYDPFNFSPYANLPPLYRPLTNVLTPGHSFAAPRSPVPGPLPVPVPVSPSSPPLQPANDDSPPSEPSDLNVLNYASKDPAIPNVPPPPLPSGGSKSDSSK